MTRRKTKQRKTAIQRKHTTSKPQGPNKAKAAIKTTVWTKSKVANITKATTKIHPANRTAIADSPPDHAFHSRTTSPATAESPFAKGWASLPTELKLQILRYLVFYGTTIGIPFLSGNDQRVLGGDNKYLRRPFRWVWKLMNANIADLSDLLLDVVLSQNTFQIDCAVHPIATFPSAEICNRIQHLKIIVTATPYGWGWFNLFVKGHFGFQNLQSLGLCISGDYTYVENLRTGRRGPMQTLGDFVAHVERTGLVVVCNAASVSIKFKNWDFNYWEHVNVEELLEIVDVHVASLSWVKELLPGHEVTREAFGWLDEEVTL